MIGDIGQVTERLGERLQNINLWKFELEKTIKDLTAEIELLVVEKRRLEFSIQVRPAIQCSQLFSHQMFRHFKFCQSLSF